MNTVAVHVDEVKTAATTANAATRAEELARAGVEAKRAGDFETAAQALEQAIAIGGVRSSWCLTYAQVLCEREDWSGASEAYRQLLEHFADEVPPRTWARLGQVRWRAGDPRGAVDAYSRAIDLAGPRSDWYAALARAHANLEEWRPAVVNFQRAVAMDGSQYRWWTGLGRAANGCGEWATAIDAYLEAMAVKELGFGSYLGLGDATRQLVRANAGVDAEGRFDRVFAALDGPAALDQFIGRYLGEPGPEVTIRSNPIAAGRSNVLILHHVITRPGHPDDEVIQKITNREGEIAVLRVLERRGADRPERLVTPQVLSVSGDELLTHAFFEFVPELNEQHMGLRGLVSSPEILEQAVLIMARIPELVLDPADQSALRTLDRSADSIRRAAQRMSQVVRERGERVGDGGLAEQVSAVGEAAELLAASARELPTVFVHNDLQGSNLQARLRNDHEVEDILVFDWGEAALDVVGSDLHALLYFRDRSGDGSEPGDGARRNLFSVYASELTKRGFATTGDQCEFGASLACFLRAAGSIEVPGFKDVFVRRAALAGCRARELAQMGIGSK